MQGDSRIAPHGNNKTFDGIRYSALRAIYDERSAQVKNKKGETVLKYFSKSSKNVQKSVTERFQNERVCAKHRLESENKSKDK